MGYTGYRVTQYIDDNPLSPTYGNTWTERELDTSHCPTGDDEWVLVATSCEATTSGFTGNMIYTYYNSATNQYSSTTASSTECDADSLNEIWVNSGDTFCEQDEDGIYSGWAIQVQVQRNSNLLNYNETREVRIPDATCAEHLEPNWTTIYSHCTIVADHVTGQLSYDGTLEELQIDDNPSSPTFNQTRVIYTPDEENCPAIICDEVERTWEFVDDICGSMMPIEYGLTGLTPDTLYHVYREYESCIVGGVPVKTEPTNRFSATTYQTSVTDCVERWVDTPQTVCIEEAFNGKWLATYTGGTTSSAECGSSSAITQNEISVDGLLSVEIGDCVTTLGSPNNYIQPPFEGATSLTSVTFGQNVNRIGVRTFRNCSGLTSIDIPSSVTYIGNSAFVNCKSLSSVTIPDSVTELGDSAFQNCYSMTSVNIGTGITRIKDFTFDNCSGLTSVTIPSSVTRIDEGAFQACKSLQSITVESTTPPLLSGTTVFNNTNNSNILVPCESQAAYITAPGWSNYKSRIKGIPPCTKLKWIATYSGGTISSTTCNGSFDSITNGEIPNTNLLESVLINDCVGLIEARTFTNSSIKSIDKAGNGINTDGIGIDYQAFKNSALEVYMPMRWNSKTWSEIYRGKIWAEAFYGCKLRRVIVIVDEMGEGAFGSNHYLTDLHVGTEVISDGAFYDCSSLTGVTWEHNVRTIGRYAFGDCRAMTTITIPSGVTSIGEGAFDYCTGLTEIIIEATTPPTLGVGAFDYTNNCLIKVPSSSLSAYQSAWPDYASRITAIS